MLPILQIGPFALQTPGLILLVGLWIGLSIAERNAHRFGMRPDQIYNLTFIMLLSGIIGARLAVVAQFPSAFIDAPINIVSLNPSLFDLIGGIVTAIIAGLIYGDRNGLKLTDTLDSLTPALGFLFIAIPLSQLASGSAFGTPTSMAWGIYLWGEIRHPTQLYHSLLQTIILWLQWPGRTQKIVLPGSNFFSWLSLSAGARIFIEAFRADSSLLPNGLRLPQISAWAILAMSLIILNKIHSNQTAIK